MVWSAHALFWGPQALLWNLQALFKSLHALLSSSAVQAAEGRVPEAEGQGTRKLVSWREGSRCGTKNTFIGRGLLRTHMGV